MVRNLVDEIYRALVLLGAESDLLSIIGTWRDGGCGEYVADQVWAWNEETLRSIKGRIEHYGMTCRHHDGNQDEALKT